MEEPPAFFVLNLPRHVQIETEAPAALESPMLQNHSMWQGQGCFGEIYGIAGPACKRGFARKRVLAYVHKTQLHKRSFLNV